MIRNKRNKLYFYSENVKNYCRLLAEMSKRKLFEEADIEIVPEDLGIGVGGEVYKGNKELQNLFHRWAAPTSDYDLMSAGNPATDKLESLRLRRKRLISERLNRSNTLSKRRLLRNV